MLFELYCLCSKNIHIIMLIMNLTCMLLKFGNHIGFKNPSEKL